MLSAQRLNSWYFSTMRSKALLEIRSTTVSQHGSTW